MSYFGFGAYTMLLQHGKEVICMIAETAAAEKTEGKEYAIRILDEMELNQIANWLRVLPEDRWKPLFLAYWPTLAKKCGVQE